MKFELILILNLWAGIRLIPMKMRCPLDVLNYSYDEAGDSCKALGEKLAG